jgi:hypothetical protein
MRAQAALLPAMDPRQQRQGQQSNEQDHLTRSATPALYRCGLYSPDPVTIEWLVGYLMVSFISITLLIEPTKYTQYDGFLV